MAELTKELKYIKKKYGEKFMHICRDNFAVILEKEGKLTEILEKTFANNSRTLGEDIVNNDKIEDFKEYIYSKINVEIAKKNNVTSKTPYEILEEQGYNLIECKSEKEIQEFKKYYAKNEVLCTIYNGGRLKTSEVFFAVKKNVEEIKREDFKKPQREDEYGTSVLGIQFDKKGVCLPHIISRYNHTVNNPNATYGNDLDKIAPGLTESFKKLLKQRGLELNNTNIEKFELPGYVVAKDRKYYKYNIEIDGIYYCPRNIVIKGGEINQLKNPESQILIDYFVINLKEKTVKLSDKYEEIDAFVDFFEEYEIEKINITKGKEGIRTIVIKIIGYDEPVEIKINKDNQIIGYKNNIVEKIGYDFLRYNKVLTEISLSSATSIKDYFLFSNKLLTEILLPSAISIGNVFLYCNESLNKISLPSAKNIGNNFLHCNKSLNKMSLPSAKSIGNSFLYRNKILTEISMPSATSIGARFLFYNELLSQISLPNATSIGNDFLRYNKNIHKILEKKLGEKISVYELSEYFIEYISKFSGELSYKVLEVEDILNMKDKEIEND